MTINVRIDGLSEMLSGLIRLMPELTSGVLDDMADAAFDVFETGARRHTRNRSSGALMASTFITAPTLTSRQVGHDSTAPHAEWVIFGSKPHEILAKNALALSWVGGGGTRFFAKRVWHPGYAGDNYFEDAAEAAVSELSASVNDIFLKGL